MGETKPSTTTQTRELGPCPRGHAGAQVCNSDERMFYVTCVDHECFWALGEGYDRDAMPDHAFRSAEEAIEAWNTRPSDTEQVIRLREALEKSAHDLHKVGAYHNPASVSFEVCQRPSCEAARAALQPKAETELEQQ